ncbi:small ribosomal subunit protein mS37 isoform X2 [Panulirus ornatus]
MRLTPFMLTTQYLINKSPKNGRRPTRQPFPFKAALPLILKDQVSGKSSKKQNVACLQEMSILFACLKKSDFAQSLCQKEIDSLDSCYKNFMHTQSQRKQEEREGLLVPREKNLSHKQLNLLLKKHPQPK